MNTCPVYRRSGGHSYGATVPGPIGSILEPARDPARHASLPFACSVCGSCTDVCPVRIDLHHQLLAWRGTLVADRHTGRVRRRALAAAGALLRRPRAIAAAGAIARASARWLPSRWLAFALRAWTRERALPDIARRSFRTEWRRRHGD